MKKNPLTFFIKLIALLFGAAAVVLLMLFSITSAIATFASAPWVPSKKKDLQRIKKAMAIKKGDIVYELGSGDARMCMYLAKNTQAKKIIGIEFSFFYFLLSKIKIITAKLQNKVNIIWGNFFKKNFKSANVIFFYLTSRAANKLSTKLLKELPKGCRVVSYHYPVSGWTYTKKDQPTKNDTPIYIYDVDKNIQSVSFTA